MLVLKAQEARKNSGRSCAILLKVAEHNVAGCKSPIPFIGVLYKTR